MKHLIFLIILLLTLNGCTLLLPDRFPSSPDQTIGLERTPLSLRGPPRGAIVDFLPNKPNPQGTLPGKILIGIGIANYAPTPLATELDVWEEFPTDRRAFPGHSATLQLQPATPLALDKGTPRLQPSTLTQDLGSYTYQTILDGDTTTLHAQLTYPYTGRELLRYCVTNPDREHTSSCLRDGVTILEADYDPIAIQRATKTITGQGESSNEIYLTLDLDITNLGGGYLHGDPLTSTLRFNIASLQGSANFACTSPQATTKPTQGQRALSTLELLLDSRNQARVTCTAQVPLSTLTQDQVTQVTLDYTYTYTANLANIPVNAY